MYVTRDAQQADHWVYVTQDARTADAIVYVLNAEDLPVEWRVA